MIIHYECIVSVYFKSKLSIILNYEKVLIKLLLWVKSSVLYIRQTSISGIWPYVKSIAIKHVRNVKCLIMKTMSSYMAY